MKKYTDGVREKLKPKMNAAGEEIVEPFRDAQKALVRAKFVSKEREDFFNEAYQDIMIQLFEKWVTTEPHAVKEREYLYHCCMAMGSVKQQLITYEMFGKNAEYVTGQRKAQEALDKKEEQ